MQCCLTAPLAKEHAFVITHNQGIQALRAATVPFSYQRALCVARPTIGYRALTRLGTFSSRPSTPRQCSELLEWTSWRYQVLRRGNARIISAAIALTAATAPPHRFAHRTGDTVDGRGIASRKNSPGLPPCDGQRCASFGSAMREMPTLSAFNIIPSMNDAVPALNDSGITIRSSVLSGRAPAAPQEIMERRPQKLA